jgi:hypothetical protein
MFASILNTKCPNFVSMYPTAGALATDALAMDWCRDNCGASLYCFPPPHLINKTFEKITQAQEIDVIALVVPTRPAQPWWPVLVEKSALPPLLFPASGEWLQPPIVATFLSLEVPQIPLTAFLFFGKDAERAVCRAKRSKQSGMLGRMARFLAETARSKTGSISAEQTRKDLARMKDILGSTHPLLASLLG